MMCMPASMVVTQDRVYWSKDSDSHTAIINEYDLYIDGVRGPNAVMIEVVPPRENYSLPLDQWEVSTDQFELPEWYNGNDVRQRVMEVLPDWIAYKVILPDQSVPVLGHNILFCYGKISIVNEYQVDMLLGTGSIATLGHYAYVRAMTDKSVINMCKDYAHVGAMRDSSCITTLQDRSGVGTMSGYAVIGTMMDDSIVDTCGDKSCIFQMSQRSRIRRVADNAKVKRMVHNASIIFLDENATVDSMSGNTCIHECADIAPRVNCIEDFAVVNFRNHYECRGRSKK